MRHDETLGKAGEYLRGELTPLEAAEVKRHLDTCRDCGALIEKWPGTLPSRDFTARVMDAISPAPQARGWLNFLFPLGSAAAVVLILAAFWHPEKSWVKSDKSFAAFDYSKRIPLRGGEKFYE